MIYRVFTPPLNYFFDMHTDILQVFASLSGSLIGAEIVRKTYILIGQIKF